MSRSGTPTTPNAKRTRPMVTITLMAATAPIDDDELDRELERYRDARAKRYGSVLTAWAISPAILATFSYGQEVVILSPEMSDPSDGPMRATRLSLDGPSGHSCGTRHDLIKRIAEDHPSEVRPMSDAEVMAWTSADRYVKGAKCVAYAMADNTIRYLVSKGAPAFEAEQAQVRARAIVETDIEGATAILHRAIAQLAALEGVMP